MKERVNVKNKREKENKHVLMLFSRYILILLFGLGNIYIIYKIFTPLTIYPVYFLFKLAYQNLYNVYVSDAVISIGRNNIEIIRACVAGSAYYLLLMLNLSVKMNVKTRILSLFYSFALFLVLNIIRIFVLGVAFFNNLSFFDLTHKLSWYLLSIFLIVFIWFSEVYLFKIKNIPIYSDIIFLKNIIKHKR